MDDVTDPDRDTMEGLLFDLGIFGDHSAALGGPRSRSGVPVQRTLSTACGAPSSISTGIISSFGGDHLRQLTEKCAHHVQGGSFNSRSVSVC